MRHRPNYSIVNIVLIIWYLFIWYLGICFIFARNWRVYTVYKQLNSPHWFRGGSTVHMWGNLHMLQAKKFVFGLNWKIVSAHTQYVTVHDIDTQRNIAKWYVCSSDFGIGLEVLPPYLFLLFLSLSFSWMLFLFFSSFGSATESSSQRHAHN
jgi:hypothetical protein